MYIFLLCCSILLVAAAIIVLIDVLPIFLDWVSRIHIGRHRDMKVWNESVTQRGGQWLNRTPKMKVTDNTRLVVLDMLQGNYTKHAIQHWQEAALLMGLSEYVGKSKDVNMEKEIITYVKAKFDHNGNWLQTPKQVDGAIVAYAVMKQRCIDPSGYKPAFDYMWSLIQEHVGEDGCVQYRKSMKNYRYVDTIGFICPFLVAYGLRYDKPECVELAVRQLVEFEKHGMLEHHYLPSHAYHMEHGTPLGLYGWGRGLGWFAIGLMDAWRELPAAHPHKGLLGGMITKFSASVLAFQGKEGNWNWTITREESRADSSATAVLGWFLSEASCLEHLNEACTGGAERAASYLMKVTRRSGAVDFSQGDTKDIGVYSMLFNILPFTQGFCIRMMNGREVPA
ncbi:hypothetical protein GCM10010911_33890 [Paenibacillus nasutitermitis]|uniref:Unsaturated rhamnogalacturonyl hydrolase n=1 Tax=Paenibacillus nasutitermitis TaxID=1652958 RepID=A0A916Z2Q6_9BACL|nr:hypothetical protein GCM10010911_33890 [Paenibacillus nasutitermitis]